MTPAEYEERVRTDYAYATSSQRWDDHLKVYPDVDGSTRDNISWLREGAVRQERTMADIEAQLALQERTEGEK